MFGGDGNDFLFGANGQDFLSGDAGNDEISVSGPGTPGEAGDDVALAGSGDDILVDCIAHNRFDGGDGNDTCEFDPRLTSAVSCETVLSCP